MGKTYPPLGPGSAPMSSFLPFNKDYSDIFNSEHYSELYNLQPPLLSFILFWLVLLESMFIIIISFVVRNFLKYLCDFI